MRIWLTLLFAALLSTPAAAAGPSIIGTDGTTALQLLDADVQPVPGSLTLPKATAGTVLSPDGRRLATWAHKTLSIRDAATGAVERTLAIDAFPDDVFWPTRNHIVTVAWKPYAKLPNVVRTFDLKTGTVRTQAFKGGPIDDQAAGTRVRLLLVGGSLDTPHGGFTVYDIGAAGKLKRTFKVPRALGTDSYAGMRLNGDQLLVTEEDKHALIGLDGKITPLALPNGYWDWLGGGLLEDSGRVIQIDRATGALGKRVDVDPDAALTPYQGGFIVGLGTARYDAGLQLVAQNTFNHAVGTEGLLVAGDRFYTLGFECFGPYGYKLVVGNADTGEILHELDGSGWRLGILGDGYLPVASYDDDCD